MSKGKIVITSQAITKVGGMERFVINMGRLFKERGWDTAFLITDGPGDGLDEARSIGEIIDLSCMSLSLKKVECAIDFLHSYQPEILLMNNTPLIHHALPRLNSFIRPVVIIHNDVSIMYGVARLNAKHIWRWVSPTPGIKSGSYTWIPKIYHDRIRVILHGINTQLFNPVYSTRDSRHIVFIGSFLPHKGVDLLPNILKKVREFDRDIRLSIIGDGDSRSDIDEKFRKMGLQDNVIWHGNLSQKMVADLLRTASILLHPTRVEAFGLVIVEAMACGAIPVVTHLDGITDSIVEDGKSGKLVRAEDINGFSQAIISLLKDPDYCERMRLSAINVASNKFAEEHMIRLYEELLSEPDERKRKPYSRLLWYNTILFNQLFKNAEKVAWLQRIKRLVKGLTYTALKEN